MMEYRGVREIVERNFVLIFFKQTIDKLTYNLLYIFENVIIQIKII